MYRTPLTTRLAIIAAVMLLPAGVASADVITLNRDATVAGSSVLLRDVARLDGPAAQKLAMVEVASLGAGDQTIGLLDVRNKLDAAGAHWGLITLRGATRISIRRAAPPTDDTANVAHGRKAGVHIAANLVGPVEAVPPAADAATAAPSLDAGPIASAVGATASPARSVRHLIVAAILGRLLADPADVRVTFSDDRDPLLDVTDAAARFEIEPIGDNPVGRVPLVIRRYEGGRLVATDRARVDVAVRRTIVVARRNLGRGQTVTDSDVGVETRWVETTLGHAITDTSAIIGQRSVGLVREGNPITLDDIQPPILIRRGQVVTVRCVSGSLVLKTVARALEDGAYGDLVPMRNERTREQFAARVSGVQQAVLSDEVPSVPAAADSELSTIQGGTTR